MDSFAALRIAELKKIGGILVDTALGQGDRLGVEISEFPEALPAGFLVVSALRHFFCTGVDLLGKGQDYRRFVVTASKLLTDFSFCNLMNVVSGYGSIWCTGCFPHSLSRRLEDCLER